MYLQLIKPLVYFDLETTGLNISQDRIIEFCFIKILPSGEREEITHRVNPDRKISQEAQTITNITDEMVKNCPKFLKFAPEVLKFLEGSDIAGYNILRFDIPVLEEEFKRCGIEWNLANHEIIDAQIIFHKHEKRNLKAALKFYCNEELNNPHEARADVETTIKVLEGQLKKYDDVSSKVSDIANYCKDSSWVDRTGRLHWINGEACLAFSKKKGTSLKIMVKEDIGMLKWVLNNNFPDDVKDIINNAFKGNFPKKI